MPETKLLDEIQLEHFNVELMHPKYWKIFIANLTTICDITKPFKLLDIGGGNGMFADEILRLFPMASVTVLDNAEYLLSKNKPSDRKRLILGSATELDKVLDDEKYDIITFNWVLHHLVVKSHKGTLQTIENTLKSAKNYLSEGGYISVIENLYPGLIIDSYTSHFIFGLTSIKTPLIAKLVFRVGFNTAGVGVCFMSPKMIHKRFNHVGLKVYLQKQLDCWHYNFVIRFCLHMRPMRMMNFWLAK